MIRCAFLAAATGDVPRHVCRRREADGDAALARYFLRETIDRVVPSNGPNPAATADA